MLRSIVRAELLEHVSDSSDTHCCFIGFMVWSPQILLVATSCASFNFFMDSVLNEIVFKK